MNTTKLVVDKKYKKDIVAACKQISKLAKEQDKLYGTLVKKLNYPAGSMAEEILFDHIYNGSDWMFEYSKE